jgi:hypothetical protein
MATTTINYGLIKPDPLDYYDVDVSNSNMDIIDEALRNNADNISAEKAARESANTALGGIINNMSVVATQTSNGLMSTTDKIKLDGVDMNANNYVHPTTAGNKHVPSGGVNDKILGYGGSSGIATWIDQLAAKSLLSTNVVDYFGGLTNVEAVLKNFVKKNNVLVISASGSWTPPWASMLIDVFILGAGGGGGGGAYGTGGGGGGGGYAKFIQNYKISSTTSIAVVIGAGGSGQTGNTNGGDGGSTSFGLITAQGGKGGHFSGSGGDGFGGDGGAGGGTGYSGSGNGASGYGGDGTNSGGRTVGRGAPYDSTLGAYCPLNNILYGGGGGGGGGIGGAGGGGNYGSSGTLYGAGGGGNGGNGYQGVIIIGYNG